MAEVSIYTTQTCPYCRAAKDFLKSKGVLFQEIDVTGDEDARERLAKKAGGRETVPQIFKGSKCIGGYDDLVEFYSNGGRL